MRDLTTLGQDFQALREKKGHWEGGDFSEDVDQFEGLKHTTMKELGMLLEKETPQTVLQVMGQPDEVSTANGLPALMPGPVVFGKVPANGEETAVLKYWWRYKHDYLYFVVDANTERILKAGWYYSGE